MSFSFRKVRLQLLLRVGIENNNDDRTIAWALEYPGCFAYGRDSLEAQDNFLPAAREYAGWIARHEASWLPSDGIDVGVEETFDVYFVDGNFELVQRGKGSSMVESFFRHDWKPLTSVDIERALKLLSWSRSDLLQTISGLSQQKLDETYGGERWSINGILKHIGGAEWWYQERIGHPYPEREDDISTQPLERLQITRDHFNALLPKLEGVQHVIGLDGELWSPRKALRRALWHERDHTNHIRKLL
ncbi:MAG: DinB family protein [Anaerolineales bacterium]